MASDPLFSSGSSFRVSSWTAERRKAFEIEQMHWMIDHTSGRHLAFEEKQQLKDITARQFHRCSRMDCKTFCSRCPVHCFRPDDAEKIRRVMKSAGWKLLLAHPIRAWRHVQIDTGRLPASSPESERGRNRERLKTCSQKKGKDRGL